MLVTLIPIVHVGIRKVGSDTGTLAVFWWDGLDISRCRGCSGNDGSMFLLCTHVGDRLIMEWVVSMFKNIKIE